MRNFEVLFDHGEAAAQEHSAFARYGPLGFPAPPEERPWIYSNFVQSLDGITSLLGPAFLGKRHFAVGGRPLADGPSSRACRRHPDRRYHAAR